MTFLLFSHKNLYVLRAKNFPATKLIIVKAKLAEQMKYFIRY